MKDITEMKLNDIQEEYKTFSNKTITMTRAAKKWGEICNGIKELQEKIENLKNLCRKEGMIVDPIEQQ